MLGARPLSDADSLVAVEPVGDDGVALKEVAPTQFVRLDDVE